MSDGPTPPETLDTARLRLRRPKPGDAEVLYDRWAQDEAVTRYLVWRTHEAVQEAHDHVARCQAAWENGTAFVWYIDDRESGELIGSLASRYDTHGVNLGYLLAREWWGRGLMAEALAPVVAWWLDQPSVFRVWATCDIDNGGSARVLEKAGFQLEGTLRRWERHPNISEEPRDSLCYAIIKT